MIWWLLACWNVEESLPKTANPVEFRTPPEDRLSTTAWKAINHVQVQSRQAHKTPETVRVWSAESTGVADALQAMFDTTPVQGQVPRTDDSVLWLILLQPNQRLPPIPPQNRLLVVFDGQWSDREMNPFTKRAEGYIQTSSSVARFIDAQNASEWDKALAIGFELQSQYGLQSKPLSSTVRSQIHPSVWHLADPEWIDSPVANKDPMVTVHRLQPESDRLLQLAQVTYYPERVSLAEAASSAEPWIRAQAYQYIEDWALLTTGIDDPSSVVRVVVAHQAATLLHQQSHQKGCQLMQQLSLSPHAYERWKAAYGLGACADSGDVLVLLFDDPDIDVVRQAVLSMGSVPNVSDYFEQIVDLTTHSNSFVRRWTWKTIGQIEHPHTLSTLERCMDSETSTLGREECAKALHQRGVKVDFPQYRPPSHDDVTVMDTSVLLTHSDPTFRKDMAKFLPSLSNGQSLLLYLMKDSDGEVRKTAVESLGYMGDKAVWNALTDPDPDVVVTALEAIRIGEIQGNCIQLQPLLDHRDGEIVLRALEAMSVVKNRAKECNQQVFEYFTHVDERIHSAAGRIVDIEQFSESTESTLLLEHVWSQRHWRQHKKSLMSQWTVGSLDQQAWVKGLIQQQDDLCHQVFSWNDPQDKPISHQGLRPPTFQPYGHPNRG